MKHLIVFLILVNFSIQFNLDLQAVHVYKNDNGFFGFTVAMIAEKGIIVGSPNADTGVEGVVKGGAVFNCSIPRLDELTSEAVICDDVIDIFIDGPNKYYNIDQTMGPVGRPTTFRPDMGMVAAENKSMELLGISMAANDKFVVACANRYEHRFWDSYEVFDLPRQLVGRCLLWDIARDRLRHSLEPCDTNIDKGYETYGNCQAGTSIALLDNILIIGTPGLNTALGGAFQYNTDDITDVREMVKIPESQEDETNDKYMGYSSVVCNMDGLTDETDPDFSNGLELIFGGPRGAMYKGQISIYSIKDPDGILLDSKFGGYRSFYNDHTYSFDGEQMGSYFGHSLACTDINNDGYDDLIVGAPWYSDRESSAILPDTGRIYVMYGSAELDTYDNLLNPLKITGQQAGAAFGFSLSNAGDMNEDGFMDVFVGAPYQDEGVGAVFLYLGSEAGLQTPHSQLIKPSSLNVLDNILTFGWSISQGKDMDGNGYPDVAIGAYKSGHVTFIRSKSIIDVIPTLNFRPVTELSETQNKTSVSVCLQYKPKPDRKALTIDQLPIRLSVTLDKEHSRLSFASDTTKVKVWTKVLTVWTDPDGRDVTCSESKEIFYDPGTGNVQPMPVTITAEIDDDSLTSLVLNQVLFLKARQDLTISSNCHPVTGVCIVDLAVSLDPLTPFVGDHLYPAVVFGKVPRFTQVITVSNVGTDAYNYVYNAAVKVTTPPEVPISFIGVASGAGLSDDVTCGVTQGHITCQLPDDGPINGDTGAQTFGIEFDVSNITSPIDIAVTVEALVEDPTVDSEETNNVATNIVEVKELADLLIRGGSVPVKVTYNNKYTIVNEAIGDKDVHITHEYSLSMDETSLTGAVENIFLDIYWPHEVATGETSSVILFPLVNVTTSVPDNVRVVCDWDPGYWVEKLEALVDAEPKKDYNLPTNIHCSNKNSSCIKIRCDINQINRGGSFYNKFKVALTGWVDEARLYDSEGLNVSSYAEISKVQDGMVLPLRFSATAKTDLAPSKTKSRNLLWIIIIAVIAGIFLLALLICILWKVGFFKRKQPPTIKADKVDEQIDMVQYGD